MTPWSSTDPVPVLGLCRRLERGRVSARPRRRSNEQPEDYRRDAPGWSHDWQSRRSHQPGRNPFRPVPWSWQATAAGSDAQTVMCSDCSPVVGRKNLLALRLASRACVATQARPSCGRRRGLVIGASRWRHESSPAWRRRVFDLVGRVELRGLEPLTSSMPWKRATNCAKAPRAWSAIPSQA